MSMPGSFSLADTRIFFSHFDLLRGFAALLVVFYHLNGDTGGNLLPLITGLGWIGVDIFFVISGAVISSSAEQLYGEDNQNWGKNFWHRRLARIYPIYLIAIFVFTLYFLPRNTIQECWELGFQFTTHLFMLHGYFPWTWQGLLGPTWSLAIEMQFYFLIWLGWPWIRRQKVWVILLIGLLCTFLWHSYFRQAHNVEEKQLLFFLSQLPGRLDEFAYGFLIFQLVKKRCAKNAIDNKILASSFFRCTLVILGIFLPLTWYYAVNGSASIFGIIGMGLHLKLGDVGVRLLFGVCAFFLVWGATLFRENKVTQGLSWFGTISYGVYLLHAIIILFLLEKGIGQYDLVFVALVLTVVLAGLSYYLIERPVMRFLAYLR